MVLGSASFFMMAIVTNGRDWVNRILVFSVTIQKMKCAAVFADQFSDHMLCFVVRTGKDLNMTVFKAVIASTVATNHV
tara:strand:+ start:3035 stop:3268 length:234 start_codon:yes stop_codon:yes gene_type:complete